MDDATLLAWIDRGRTLSFALVAVGVVGEFLVDRVSGPIIKRRDDAQRAEIARLNKDAGDARRSASEAVERAAIAEENTEKEKIARLKLEERLAWRRIGPKEHDAMVTALKPHAGAVVEVFQLGDIEANTFAADIIKTLRDSGWVVRITGAGVLVPPTYGLQCSINESLPAGKSLAVAFKSLPTAQITSDTGLPLIARIRVLLRPAP
jgi:hypothetical protein